MIHWIRDGHKIHWIQENGAIVDRWVEHPSSCPTTITRSLSRVYEVPTCKLSYEEEAVGLDENNVEYGDDLPWEQELSDGKWEIEIEWYFTEFRVSYEYGVETDCEFAWRPVAAYPS